MRAGSATNRHKKPSMAIRWIKVFAWWVCGSVTSLARCVATLLRRRRKVDVLIYKVDRLGDWFMAEPAITSIIAATHAKGGNVAIWASRETSALRIWREPGCTVESFVFEPSGLYAKVRRAVAVVRLLALYQARTLICLRHSPEPVRDFVLDQADATDIRALSWRIFPGVPGPVPHEIARHFALLSEVGFAPATSSELLPKLVQKVRPPSTRVVIAPFSSARIKDWSDNAWRAVVAALADRDWKFEIWVGPDQITRAEELARQLQSQGHALDVAIKSGTLPELAGAVGSASLVLAVDTFAAHLAVASDVPTVCLIGGGQFGDFGPWQRSERQCWIAHRLPCFGCNWQCTRPRVECLQDINPAKVVSAIAAVFSAKNVDQAIPNHPKEGR